MAIRKIEKEKKPKARTPVTGVGKIDKVGKSGVYPMSGPHPPGDAPMIWPGSWGQGKRGAAGYEDHGDSELTFKRVVPEKCRDIMTKDPAFCQANDTVAIAAKLMEKHNIGVLPVVANLHTVKLAGILTDRDLAMKMIADERDPHKTLVREVMSHPVVTCSPDDDYHVALDLMEKHQVKRIPAVDNSGRVVGMISQADIALRVADRAEIAELVTSIAEPR